MEGSFMPGYFRAKIVNETRGTHFTLGQNPNTYSTTHHNEFSNTTPTKSRLISTNKITSIKLSSDSPITKNSESSYQYRSYTEVPKSKIIKPPMSLFLSQSPGSYITTSSKAYKIESSTPIPKMIEKPVKIRDARKQNFNISEGTKIIYKTAMQNDYRYEKILEKVVTDKDIKKKVENTQRQIEKVEKTGAYITTNYENYKTYKSLSPVKIARNKEITSIPVMNEKNDNLTMAQLAFQHKKPNPIPTENLDKKAENPKNPDKRATNFTLGTMQNTYKISSKLEDYSQNLHDEIKYKTASPTSVKLGSDNLSFKTSYSENYTLSPLSLPNGYKKAQRNENYSHVNLGEESPNFVSHSHIAYKNLSASPAKLPYYTEKHLKSHHFDIGNGDKNFVTTALEYGKSASPEPRYDLRERVNKMKESHWSFGNYPIQGQSNFMNEYKWKGKNERARLDYNDIRKTNFQIGPDKNTWKSSYNGNYNWIQPVADTDYKFSLMKN
ncbi:hypothetical protein SteCoe_16926 [Stentor coeruleus]|uniref:Uncharacterized protein n=1 Tax=Stentor coeruleus TaxID=5963 RepID=A0A1R2C049_9CILI|nr:hypothetical protein SteCoe_16926 [Stentor coeruleus]